VTFVQGTNGLQPGLKSLVNSSGFSGSLVDAVFSSPNDLTFIEADVFGTGQIPFLCQRMTDLTGVGSYFVSSGNAFDTCWMNYVSSMSSFADSSDPVVVLGIERRSRCTSTKNDGFTFLCVLRSVFDKTPVCFMGLTSEETQLICAPGFSAASTVHSKVANQGDAVWQYTIAAEVNGYQVCLCFL
jgi:hypothetical protein